jgi:hypothetical protein
VLFTDSDRSARLLLQVVLLELGLPTDLAELDRRVQADPAYLQEIKRRALRYVATAPGPAGAGPGARG